MNQTIDQLNRPEGHPGACTCADCAVWRSRAGFRSGAAAGQEWRAPAVPQPEPEADYLRRIHFWVRLFGIVWIVIPLVALILGGVVGVGAIVAAKAQAPSAYERCVANGTGIVTCAGMYPRD